MQKQSYRQPLIHNAMYNTQQQMENITNSPQKKVYFFKIIFWKNCTYF